ncbi:MAG: aa3-type cytochrome c oxidase subunit IV [Paracoccaceae bacterium]
MRRLAQRIGPRNGQQREMEAMMAAHKHGTMDISGHEKTFSGFVRGSVWVAALSIAALVFLAVFNS